MKLEAVMVDSSYPLDMSTKDYFIPSPPCPPQPSPPSPPGVSPPPLTKKEKKTPSSPKEFFARLYGPDTTNKSTNEPPFVPEDIKNPNSYSSLHSHS